MMNPMDAVEDVSEERRMIIVSVTSSERRTTISVRDLGHGIRASEQSKIFNSFYSSFPPMQPTVQDPCTADAS